MTHHLRLVRTFLVVNNRSPVGASSSERGPCWERSHHRRGRTGPSASAAAGGVDPVPAGLALGLSSAEARVPVPWSQTGCTETT